MGTVDERHKHYSRDLGFLLREKNQLVAFDIPASDLAFEVEPERDPLNPRER